jgi:hypothetical protein
MTPPRLLVVSLAATSGLRAADEQLAESLRRAGADVRVAAARRPREVRTLALTDLVWARAARAAAQDALRAGPADAVIYSSTTAALLWPRPGAIRFDAPARGNRPGRHGVWQRSLERRRLAAAPLCLPWSSGAAREAGPALDPDRTVVVPVAVEPSGPPPEHRDLAAISYVANPDKKGTDRVLEAWRRVRRDGEELVLAGADLAVSEPGVRVVGRLAPDEYRALLRRARVFVCAPRREDYGIAQLEALADGCRLVTTPSPGPYAALPLARELDGALVGEDVGAALRRALDAPPDDYAQRAAALLAPFAPAAVHAVVAGELLSRL